MQKLYLALADLILVLHMSIVLFIVLGFVLIWIGYFCRWKFVRNFYFRSVHLLAMGYVSVQKLLGANCPLTIWENDLRIRGGADAYYEGTFIGHWFGKILFYDVGLGTFAVIYTLFFLFVVFTWFLVRPVSPRGWVKQKS